MKQLLSAALFGASVLALAACSSGHLTRSNAKSQLEKAAQQAQQQNPDGPHSLTIHIGTVSGKCYNEPMMQDYDPVANSKEDALLSTTGYVTLRPVKKHVWEVELTQLGNQAAGEKYAHTQKTDCDAWYVQFPLSKYDHLDVTGIVEDGVHAKVDVLLTFVITPVGLAVRKVASSVILETDTKTYGAKLAQDFLSNNTRSILGDDLAYAPQDASRYVKQATVAFEKYDDGWNVATKQ
ncbi:MAG: hypothetical protein ABSG79_25295 [Bryobacteraceae bacterium]|jgi:hypothetical protein